MPIELDFPEFPFEEAPGLIGCRQEPWNGVLVVVDHIPFTTGDKVTFDVTVCGDTDGQSVAAQTQGVVNVTADTTSVSYTIPWEGVLDAVTEAPSSPPTAAPPSTAARHQPRRKPSSGTPASSPVAPSAVRTAESYWARPRVDGRRSLHRHLRWRRCAGTSVSQTSMARAQTLMSQDRSVPCRWILTVCHRTLTDASWCHRSLITAGQRLSAPSVR